MSDDRNYQATSAPYSADNLKVHDAGLVFAKEFGTQTTADAGDAFTTDAGDTAESDNSINARMGMLEVSSVDDSISAPRGTTFEIPPLSAYPTSPLFQDPTIRAYTLTAHLLLAEMNEGGVTDNTEALVVLAGDGFVGSVPNAPFIGVGMNPEGGAEQGNEHNAISVEFENGGDNGATFIGQSLEWGSNLYIRLLISGSTEKDAADVSVSIGRDGMTWTQQESLQANFAITRCGISIQDVGRVWLDWVRTYSYIVTAVDNDALVPYPPLTGGRRFY